MKIPRFTSSIWKYKNYLMLLFLMLFVVIVVLSSTLERKYDLKLGEVSTYTIKAPRETLDRISTEQRVKIAREEVSAQFNHVKEVRYDVLDKLSNLFKELYELKNYSSIATVIFDELNQKYGIALDAAGYRKILALDTESMTNYERLLTDIINKI
ncbi:Putative hydrolase, partial [Candidatus Arthromitus sp. SFB-2]